MKLVDNHFGANEISGYSIEAFNALGDTIGVTAVPETALEPLRDDEILCTRRLPAA